MTYRQKQAATQKLAQVRMAINHVMRKRAMAKQAAGQIGGTLRQAPPPRGKTPNVGYNVMFHGPTGMTGYTFTRKKPPQKRFAFTGPTSSTGQVPGNNSGWYLNDSGHDTLNQGTPQSPSWNEPSRPEY